MKDSELSAKSENQLRVRVNTTINGEPARILLELKQRGLVRSNTDAVNQGLVALSEKVLKRDLALAKLKAIKEPEEV